MSNTNQSLSKLDELAKVYASLYASPHHIVFTVEGLRNLLAEANQSKEEGSFSGGADLTLCERIIAAASDEAQAPRARLQHVIAIVEMAKRAPRPLGGWPPGDDISSQSEAAAPAAGVRVGPPWCCEKGEEANVKVCRDCVAAHSALGSAPCVAPNLTDDRLDDICVAARSGNLAEVRRAVELALSSQSEAR